MNRLGFFPSFIFAVFCLFCCFFWGEGCQRAYIGGSGGLLFNLLVNPRALKKSVIFLNQPTPIDSCHRKLTKMAVELCSLLLNEGSCENSGKFKQDLSQNAFHKMNVFHTKCLRKWCSR